MTAMREPREEGRDPRADARRQLDFTPDDFGPFRIESLPTGIVILWFDDPGRKVNVLDSGSLEMLQRALGAIKHRSTDPRALILASGKEGQFIAGADVKEFDRLQTPAEAEAKAKAAQELFQEFADLPYPTIAAIDGPSLGGGTELALAFRHRVASNNRNTLIGLPEVKLGILPGFGGTQRLPRLIGFTQAVSMIVSGRSVDANRARRMGLVDDVIPHERFAARVVEWAEALLSKPKPQKRGGPSLLDQTLQSVSPLRSYVLSQARKAVLQQTGGHYPAPLEVLRVLGATYGSRIQEGLKVERKAVAKLLFTPESLNLRHIFLMSEDAKRTPSAAAALPVDSVAVLGAGTMGGEIAYLFTRAGIRVRLRDIKPEPILHSLAHARSLFDREVAKKRMRRSEMELAMARIEPVLELNGLGRTDLVLEAVVEDLNVKQQVLRDVEEQVSENSVLATNTSSLSVRAMARAMRRPGRLAGMHFFNPAARMPLVEVIRTEATDPAARETVVALSRRIKKTPVLVRDSPGFLVNRVLMPYLSEAVGLVERGVDITVIDAELRRFGMPMGPLELLDEIGLDVARKVAHVLQEAFGARVGSTGLLDRLVGAGTLGKKSGLGFYRYEQGHRRGVNPALAPSGGSKSGGKNEPPPMPATEIRDRLLDAMVNEGAMALDDRVVERAEDVDLAMVLGTGFPPFRGGLLRYADEAGIGAIVERLTRRQQEGAPSGPCGKLQRMALSNERFYPVR